MKIKKILIANRGEIACRIIKTARKMGIQTVAIYSEADADSLHVRLADETIYIGPSSATFSYLNKKSILNAAKISGADAIHPGYGFLSENATFAELAEKNGIIFIGPSAEAIRKMGDKIQAKKLAQEAGVNIVPGHIGTIHSLQTALKVANKIGYPVMIKAIAGGGGKGMRIVRNNQEMEQALSSTRNEAKNNFSDERTFIEKYIESPRHIEIQVIADKYGNYVCLGERECSIQRRHQKLIEEAPSPFIDDKIRKKMYAQSILLAKKVQYFSAGTVEYIADSKKHFYFMEMNTRVQVEHPVTELVAGVDIIALMIDIAQGKQLPFSQKDINLNGWAIESRIYAEDSTCGFLPSTGRVTTYKEPESSSTIRVDTGTYEGGEVSIFYDAMLAKLCTFAQTRAESLDMMKEALGAFVIRGVSTNIGFLQSIINSPKFRAADISTHFIDEEYKGGFEGPQLSSEQSTVMLCAAVFIHLTEIRRSMTITGQIQEAQRRGLGTRWIVMLDDTQSYPVTVRVIEDGYRITFENQKLYITSKWALGHKLCQCILNGKNYTLQAEFIGGTLYLTFMGSTVKTSLLTLKAAELNKFMKIEQDNEAPPSDLHSNISGMITDIKVQVGDNVIKGQPLVILEAMKMENVLTSPLDGSVEQILVTKGDSVGTGTCLIAFKKETHYIPKSLKGVNTVK